MTSVINAESVSHALAGATGGVIAMGILYPLENIRTRMQVQEHKLARQAKAAVVESNGSNQSSSSSSATDERLGHLRHISDFVSEEDKYQSSYDCAIKVIQSEGFSKLYTGLESALFGVGLSSAIYFFWYSALKSMILQRTGRRSIAPMPNLLIASAAGVLNVFITLPMWVVNTRMTVQKKSSTVNENERYRNTWDCVKKIYKSEGLYALWQGLIPSLILVSNPAIQFLVYEQFVRILSKRVAHSTSRSSHKLTSIEYFIIGAVSKAIATVATYPYQVLKSRQQAHKNATQSTWKLMVDMWKNEGWASFWNGMAAKMSQTVLNSAFMFVVYENLVQMMLLLFKTTFGLSLPPSAPEHHRHKPLEPVDKEHYAEVSAAALASAADESVPATASLAVTQDTQAPPTN